MKHAVRSLHQASTVHLWWRRMVYAVRLGALGLWWCTACSPGPKVGDAAGDQASLAVEVTPPEGITILLDDQKLATCAPLHTQVLAGNHVLQVRGMGYLPLSLPLTLNPGDNLTVPVSLRRRPPPQLSHPPGPPGPPPGARAAKKARPEPRPEPAVEAHVDLPPGIAPLLLHLMPEPAASITIDGVRSTGREVRMQHVRGTLVVGPLRIPYDITSSRVLEFEVPDDDATWLKDGVIVKPTSVLRLLHGSTRLRRQTTASDQSVIVQRVL